MAASPRFCCIVLNIMLELCTARVDGGIKSKAILGVHNVLHVCMTKGCVCSMSVQGVKHTYLYTVYIQHTVCIPVYI